MACAYLGQPSLRTPNDAGILGVTCGRRHDPVGGNKPDFHAPVLSAAISRGNSASAAFLHRTFAEVRLEVGPTLVFTRRLDHDLRWVEVQANARSSADNGCCIEGAVVIQP